MAFPVSPTVGSTYTASGTTYLWDGEKWTTTGEGGARFLVGATGPQGPAGTQGTQGIQGIQGLAGGATSLSGLFTPSWVSGFNITTLFNQEGYYYKIDRFVHFTLKLGFGNQAAFKSNSDGLRIGGLPFMSSTEVSYMGGCVMCKNNYGTDFDNVLISIEPGTTEVSFYRNFTPIAGDEISHNFKYLVISGNYMTA